MLGLSCLLCYHKKCSCINLMDNFDGILNVLQLPQGKYPHTLKAMKLLAYICAAAPQFLIVLPKLFDVGDEGVRWGLFHQRFVVQILLNLGYKGGHS